MMENVAFVCMHTGNSYQDCMNMSYISFLSFSRAVREIYNSKFSQNKVNQNSPKIPNTKMDIEGLNALFNR